MCDRDRERLCPRPGDTVRVREMRRKQVRQIHPGQSATFCPSEEEDSVYSFIAAGSCVCRCSAVVLTCVGIMGMNVSISVYVCVRNKSDESQYIFWAFKCPALETVAVLCIFKEPVHY